jgi:phospholipid/cholesterol/gamma-HCH transport system substrate-binding protein
MTTLIRERLPRTSKVVVLSVVGALLVVAAMGGAFWYYVSGRADQTHFSALFTESVGVYPGSDVRMLGVAVGTVDDVKPKGTAVEIDMHLDGGVSVAADTQAVIISPSLVSDRYVQLTGLYTSGPKLTDGAVIPLSRTATSVEIDELTNSVIGLTKALGPNGANRTGALADLLNVGAANLRGNGAALRKTIQRLSAAAGTLSHNRGALFQTINNLATFTRTLARDDRSVRGLNTSLAAVSDVLARDRESFVAALHELSRALSTVRQFIVAHRAALTSNVRKLAVITQILSTERDSLAQALRAAPLAVGNLINAYDPAHGTLTGRGDLNELELWKSVNGGSR